MHHQLLVLFSLLGLKWAGHAWAQPVTADLPNIANKAFDVYLPRADHQAECRRGPSFMINASTQQMSWGAISGAGHRGDIIFDLTNNANGLNVHCEVKQANELNNCTASTAKPKWFDCQTPTPNDVGQVPLGTTTTRFTFNVTSQQIIINQTWYCADGEDGPVKFTAVTKPTTLDLACTRQGASPYLFGPPSSTSPTLEEWRCRLPQMWNLNMFVFINCDMSGPQTIPAVVDSQVAT